MNKATKLGLLLMTTMLFLVGCGDEKEQQRLTIQNFDIIDTYEYDKVKVVVEDEKTPEELAYDVLMDSMGLANNNTEGYKEVGISEDNGVFINAGILEGNRIPKVSGYSTEDAVNINNDNQQSDSSRLEYFQELQANREYKVSTYDEEQVMKETAERIKQAAMEQDIRIQEQEDKKFMQDAEQGVPEFNIESGGADLEGNVSEE